MEDGVKPGMFGSWLEALGNLAAAILIALFLWLLAITFVIIAEPGP